jgi:transcriptional regulator with XRE-family HTH domain
MGIGELIRAKRQENKLSQRALAKLVDVSPGAVAQWELGDTLPTNEHMAVLKTLLDLEAGVTLSPGAPYAGQLVDDLDELAWLYFWRGLDENRRIALLDFLHIRRRATGEQV